MISGSFHPLAQEWRYYSREKSLIHTLHLAQLASGTPGDTILIASNPNLLNKGLGLSSFSVPNLQLPGPPSLNASIFNTFLQSVGSACYGCVSNTRIITAQKQCGISIDSWTNTLMKITFSPALSGRFLVHVEAETDQRNGTYQGPNSNGDLNITAVADGSNTLASAVAQVLQSNMSAATKEIINVLHGSSSGLGQINGSLVVQGTNLGDPAGTPPASISAFILMVDPHP